MVKSRMRIDLTLTKDGEEVYSTTRWMKNRIIAECERRKFDYGVCRVWYSKDYWNQFDFTSRSELKEVLAVDTELDLVKDFVG